MKFTFCRYIGTNHTMRHFLSIHQYKCTMRRCIHTTSLGILLSYSVAFGMGEIKDVTKTFWWWRWSRKGRLAPASNLRTGNWGWFWSSCFEIRFTTCHTQERVQRPGLHDPSRIRFSATWAIRPRSYKIFFRPCGRRTMTNGSLVRMPFLHS